MDGSNLFLTGLFFQTKSCPKKLTQTDLIKRVKKATIDPSRRPTADGSEKELKAERTAGSPEGEGQQSQGANRDMGCAPPLDLESAISIVEACALGNHPTPELWQREEFLTT